MLRPWGDVAGGGCRIEGSPGETTRPVRVPLFGFAAGELRYRDALVNDGQTITG